MPTIRNDSSNNQNQTKKQIRRNNRAIDKRLNILDRKVDELYKDIYISRTDNIHNIDSIIDDIDATIDKIQGLDTSTAGISELLRRVDQKEHTNTQQLMDSVADLFGNDNVLSSVFMNDDVHKFIAAQNYNFDLICKYLPRLNDALEIKRDNVLCSDNFDKEFLIPESPSLSKEAIALFNSNADKLEIEYNLSEFLDDTYMKTSKYGEDFIYVVPYPIAFERIFKREKRNAANNSMIQGVQQTLFEGYNKVSLTKDGYQESKEFVSYTEDIKEFLENSEASLKNIPELGEVNVYINPTPVASHSINEFAIMRKTQSKSITESLSSIYESASGMTSIFNDVIATKGRRGRTLSGLDNDGLILDKNLDRDPSKIDKDMLGAVLERLPRENVIPVYIGKRCVGYYYFEFAEDRSACGFCGGHHMTPGLANSMKHGYDMSNQHQEIVARYIADKVSRLIDTKFINANKDLKEDIYAILRYNEQFNITRSNNIGVTFIPAEDIVHCYFKLDETTHRGVSDLENAIIPAMLYILLYLTDIIGRITRSTDKRVYYVKQNVEQNVARTMMNVVAQIKKGSRKAVAQHIK